MNVQVTYNEDGSYLFKVTTTNKQNPFKIPIELRLIKILKTIIKIMKREKEYKKKEKKYIKLLE